MPRLRFGRDAGHGCRQRSEPFDKLRTGFPAPCMTPSIAAPSGSKARMSEHRDVRVRAGPLGARSAGQWRQHDVVETIMLTRNGFGYFPGKESNSARGSERNQGNLAVCAARHLLPQGEKGQSRETIHVALPDRHPCLTLSRCTRCHSRDRVNATASTLQKTPVVAIFAGLMRGGAVWQLVGLITRRSQVQILPPLPDLSSARMRSAEERMENGELRNGLSAHFSFLAFEWVAKLLRSASRAPAVLGILMY